MQCLCRRIFILQCGMPTYPQQTEPPDLLTATRMTVQQPIIVQTSATRVFLHGQDPMLVLRKHLPAYVLEEMHSISLLLLSARKLQWKPEVAAMLSTTIMSQGSGSSSSAGTVIAHHTSGISTQMVKLRAIPISRRATLNTHSNSSSCQTCTHKPELAWLTDSPIQGIKQPLSMR